MKKAFIKLATLAAVAASLVTGCGKASENSALQAGSTSCTRTWFEIQGSFGSVTDWIIFDNDGMAKGVNRIGVLPQPYNLYVDSAGRCHVSQPERLLDLVLINLGGELGLADYQDGMFYGVNGSYTSVSSDQRNYTLSVSFKTLSHSSGPILAFDNVKFGGAAYKAGIRNGDWLLRVNGAKIYSLADYDAEIAALKASGARSTVMRIVTPSSQYLDILVRFPVL